MPEKNHKDDERNDKRKNEVKVPARGWILLLAIAGIIPLLMFVREHAESEVKTLDPAEFLNYATNKEILVGRITYKPQSEIREITGYLSENGPVEDPISPAEAKAKGVPFKTSMPLTDSMYETLIETGRFPEINEPNTLWIGVFTSLLPFVIIILIVYFFFIRQIKMAGKGALSFGKSRAKILSKEKNKVTFKDVAGVEEAKEEVSELVEYLKDPKKFQKLGGKIPKGILMVGAPGTGKTLLAKAIAGEADASFFTISGSDFVEMFVGVGASRVRDMFEQARKSTPCLIFIDEIDAVGRSRGVGLGGGNDEREQTLNALLVEMDGFDTQEGIIIIAATNRPDVLDPALLRPGRFDRQVTINLPDVRGREAILKVHARNVRLDPSVDLSLTARGTPGFSGAELANLLNEAALLAARDGKKAIGKAELDEARDKVRWGRERRSLAMTDEDKKFTAWHEAGHALVNVLLEHTHPLHKVTIIPRGRSLGSTMYLPEDDVYNHRKKEMLDLIAVMMAGRIAEEIVSGDISSGAAADIQQATNIARSMVCLWGMSDAIGMVQYGSDEEVYLGRDMIRKKDYSEDAAMKIDAEVKSIIDAQYAVAKKIIEENRDKLEIISNALLEHETLDGEQVQEIIDTGKFTPPEPPPEVDAPKGAEAATTGSEVPKKSPPELPGLGSPAPATV